MALTNNKAVLSWIDEMAQMTQPDQIVWIDGSQEQIDALRAQACSTGELEKLNQEKLPDCYLHRTAVNDVARVEDRPFICCRNKEDAGPTNNWMDPQEMYAKLKKLYTGAMKGRTMYVIPYSMGVVGSPFAKYGIELTDSIYVVLNMCIMTRVGAAVAEKMGGKRVIIRTLDIGADKQIDYFGLDKEENPALGYRAVRICLNKREVFKTQLRALCRASAFGRIAIMVPMIISVWEVRTVKEILERIKEELKEEGKEVGDIEFGIMIETPASVIIADELAKEVDFFSIGTNDLTQYTLAIDRQNAKLDMFYNAHHPAILRMIKMVVDAAHKEGIWAGICGELGADTTLTEEFVNMGLDELSVSPGMVLPVRNKVVNM